jgi:hypothetical protein
LTLAMCAFNVEAQSLNSSTAADYAFTPAAPIGGASHRNR